LPLVLENRQVDRVPFFHNLSHNMHEIMAVFAATGAFLSFFHQGSLGGVAGVLFGRPFGFREHIFIWPFTFFLFTWSAAAYGPCFTIFITKLTEKIAGKKLVKDNVIELLAKIAGWMMATYVVAKIIDTWYWAAVTAPSMGFTLMDFYSNNPGSVYGIWINCRSRGLRHSACSDSDYRERPKESGRAVDGHHPCHHRRIVKSMGHGASGSGGSGNAV
jgi:molybdopterin-containing oxidoreductase family membrane subunit